MVSFPLDEKTLNPLKHKHSQSQTAHKGTLIDAESPVIHLIIFDGIIEELVGTTVIRTKDGSGLTRSDADGRRKMLTSKVFGSCTFDLRKVIGDFIKHICVTKTEFQNNATPFETYIAGRLMPLD